MRYLLLSTILLFTVYGGAQSPYISKVFDYRPAPGQFINELPLYEEGDTKEDMIRKAENAIKGTNEQIVSLGGYGGYIVFGFDHMVKNIEGKRDFIVWGNAFYANDNPNSEAPVEGGSCEPGIVMVSYDANNNGLPDDEWYELAGSEYYKPETIKNYALTYYKPDPNKVEVPDEENPHLNDLTYIKWESNQDDEGYIVRNIFHEQSYYPLWLSDETLVFEGTKLKDNYVDESGQGWYYVLYANQFGYADDHPNTSEKAQLDIDWAVDKNGNPVKLPGIHFVKVYTGVNQTCGWLGETSTEVLGAEDLNFSISNIYDESIDQINSLVLLQNPVEDEMILTSNSSQQIVIYDINGRRVLMADILGGTNYVDCSDLTQGIYIIRSGSESIKFVKK